MEKYPQPSTSPYSHVLVMEDVDTWTVSVPRYFADPERMHSWDVELDEHATGLYVAHSAHNLTDAAKPLGMTDHILSTFIRAIVKLWVEMDQSSQDQARLV